MKQRRAMTLCATLAIVAVGACDRASSSVAKITPLVVGAPAPAYSTRALTGETLSFGGSSAHDVVLLNVWATWCASCREEFHELERLRAVYALHGLRVVAVSVDQGGDLKVRQFVAAQKSTFPVAHDRDATGGGASTGHVHRGQIDSAPLRQNALLRGRFARAAFRYREIGLHVFSRRIFGAQSITLWSIHPAQERDHQISNNFKR